MARLFLVSTGPGNLALLPPMARHAIAQATDLVAYGLYVDLLGDLADGKVRHDRALGEETDRARLALDLAASGKTTALLSSGDIGIYAMASLVYELLDRQLQGQENYPEWLEVEIEAIPGISAMQGASSKAGAMLGHDFCTISLSDLLTPWKAIEKRIHGAGAGDFVVSFYNPVSKKRDWQLNKARDILLEYRPGLTPVILARNVSRDDEQIHITTLEQLDAKDVDMFTVVSVGNKESKTIHYHNQTRVYTPRGYGKKLV